MSEFTSRRPGGRPLAEDTRDLLRVLVQREGVRAVASRLGIASNTVARALAGLGMYEATRVLIEQRLMEEERAS